MIQANESKGAKPSFIPASEFETQHPVIKVIGVGGGGGNAIAHMVKTKIKGIEFLAANTDVQALQFLPPEVVKIQIGRDLTKGLGAGADPKQGQMAALENQHEIKAKLEGTNLLFITAGMGGGTGTGASPVIAKFAHDLGILTIGVVNTPYVEERRDDPAKEGVKKLEEFVDSLIVIPNNKLANMGDNIPLWETFAAANNVLAEAVGGIADIINIPGFINLDFADVRTVTRARGPAIVGSARATGEDRVNQVIELATNNPLIDDVELRGACCALVNAIGGRKFTNKESNAIRAHFADLLADDALFLWGAAQSDDLDDEELCLTVMITGVKPSDPFSSGKDAGNDVGRADREPVLPVAESRATDPIENPNLKAMPKPDNVGCSPKSLDVPAFLRNQAD